MRTIFSSGAVVSVLLAARALAGEPPPSADLTGNWSNASVTKLTRPPGVSALVASPAQARALAARSAQVRLIDEDASAASVSQPLGPAASPGAYNGFWTDPGLSLAEVKGQLRTSWIVDPADGQLPLSPQGRALVAAAAAHRAHADTPEGPEALEPWDRCLIGSRGSGGPGLLNNLYNSNYQFVETPTALAIVVEMIHEVRTIPIFADRRRAQAAHGPSVHRWLGDSVAWREGRTLVVETVDVNPEQGRAGPLFLSPRGRVTERFTRASATRIDYAFEVEDPVYYTRPWRAEMTLRALNGHLYEYACHEGNYAMTGILAAQQQAGASTPDR